MSKLLKKSRRRPWGLLASLGLGIGGVLQAQEKGVVMVELPLTAASRAKVKKAEHSAGQTGVVADVQISVKFEERDASYGDTLAVGPGVIRETSKGLVITAGPFSVENGPARLERPAGKETAYRLSTWVDLMVPGEPMNDWVIQLGSFRFANRTEYEKFKNTVEHDGALITADRGEPDAEGLLPIRYQPLGITPEAFQVFTTNRLETKGAVETKGTGKPGS